MSAKPMLGDIVKPRTGRDPLTSGCSRYYDAVVVRVEPFALVSRRADMLWSCTVSREDFEAVGEATEEMFEACLLRLTLGLTNRNLKRQRAKARKRLRRRRS